MNGRNSEVPGVIMVAAMIGAAAFVVAAIVYAAIAFLALVLTIVCLFAWGKPVSVFGDVVEPETARAFVIRGLIGAGLAFAFTLFCGLLFGIHLQSDAIPYILIAGYSAGSVGIEYLKAQQAEEAFKKAKLVPELAPVAAPAEAAPQPTSEAPFRFASWDDEIGPTAPQETDRCRSCAWNDEGYRPMPGVSLR